MHPGRSIAMLIAAATAGVVLWPAATRFADSQTVMFTVWGAPFEDSLFRDKYAREWERLNPGVTVDYRRFGDELLSKYNAWHTRGRGAEVMRIRVTDYLGMASRGLLMPLDDYLAPPPAEPTEEAANKPEPIRRRPMPTLRTRPGLRKSDEPAPVAPPADLVQFQRLSEAIADVPRHLQPLLTVDGFYGEHIYGLPEDSAQFGLFYNRALFIKHNQENPQNQVNFPPADGSWTWDDFRLTAIKLTRFEEPRGDAPPRMVQAGIDFAIWSWPFMTFFAQADGELWSPDGLSCTINSSAGVETLTMLRGMQRQDRSFNPSLSGYQSGTGPDALFAAGRTAMLLDGSWRVPNLELVAPDLDFAVAPLPRGKVPAVVSGCVMWAISANAANPDEGFRMLEWLVEPEQAITYWESLRVAPPASLKALDSARFRQTPGLAKPNDSGWIIPPMTEGNYEKRAAWLKFATTPHPEIGRPPGFVPVHPYQTELEDEIRRMLNEWLKPSNEERPKDVLDRVADHMHRLIDRDRQTQGLEPVNRDR